MRAVREQGGAHRHLIIRHAQRIPMQIACTRRVAARNAPRIRSMALRHIMAASPLLFAPMSSAASGAPTLHTLEGTAIDASKMSMSAFAGKPVLMVNVASR